MPRKSPIPVHFKIDSLRIDKGYPTPEPRGESPLRGIFKRMKPGDSVLLPTAFASTARTIAKVFFGKGNYASRADGKNAVRFWRIK